METTRNKHSELSSIALFGSINKLGLSEVQAEKLLNLFLRNPKTRVISSRDISHETGLPLGISSNILLTLSREGILELDILLCPHCGALIKIFPDNGICHCGNDLNLQENISVIINGSLDKENQIHLSEYAATNRAAKRLADAWKRNGHIYYLILDLVSSQSVQTQLGDGGYNAFQGIIRRIAKYKVLSHINGAFLSFGEIGDMYKMGFEKSEEAIEAVCLLSKNLPERSKDIKPETPFPCYSGSISKLELPIRDDGHSHDPFDLLSTTINGVPDINTIALTNIYRYYYDIKTDYNIYKNDCDISLWFFASVIEGKNISIKLPKKIDGISLNIPEIAWYPFKFNKNGIIGTNKAFMMYIKNGSISGIEKNPKKIILKEEKTR
jgi:hypothetical protein